jgi:hypothetical protein
MATEMKDALLAPFVKILAADILHAILVLHFIM